MRCVLFLLLFCLAPRAQAQRELTTFEVNYADAQQLAQVIRSYLSEGSVVQNYQGTLIVNATPQELATVRQLLAQLDTRSRQLLISVKVGSQVQGSSTGGAITTAPVVTTQNGIRTETRSQVTVQQRGFQGSGEQGHGVRASEGSAALISTGQWLPVSTSQLDRYGRVQSTSGEMTISSGFYATAWLDGEAVSIELDQQQQSRDGHTVNSLQLQSRVSGRIGEWIAVGMVGTAGQQRSGTLGTGGLGGERGQTTGGQTVYLKVEALD